MFSKICIFFLLMLKYRRGGYMSKNTCGYCGVNTLHSKDDYYVRDKAEEDFYLLMFFKTNFMYYKNGKMVKGDKFHYLLNSPQKRVEHGSCDEPFSNDWIFFRGDDAEDIIKAFKIPTDEPFYIDNHSAIFPFIAEISNEKLLKGTCYEEKLDCLIKNMLIDLGRKFEQKQKSKNHYYKELNEAREFMLSNLDKKITLEEISKRANYSLSRFCILYKRYFKISPIEDLTLARIEKAIELLKYNHISVSKTAEMCGFSSIHYFSRKFKEKTGVSPAKFMKQNCG